MAISITTSAPDNVKPFPCLLFLLNLCLAAPALMAQDKDTSQYEAPFMEGELFADYFFNSSALTTEFVNTVYSGGYITADIKDRVTGKLRYSNRFGADLNYGAVFRCKPASFFGRNDIYWSAGFRDRLHLDGVFSQDLYKVALYGNKQFAGQSADLGNTRFNLLRFQQLQFGIVIQGDSAHGDYGFSFSLLKGEQNMALDVDRAILSTSADGTEIDLDLAMNMRRSDTASTGPRAFNGYGASFDLFYEIPYVTWYNYGTMRLDIFDLGLIRWNNRSMYLKHDSLYHYDGIEINDLNDLQNQTIPSGNADSVVNANFHYSREPYTTFLPAVFSISATTYYGKKFIFEKGISYRFNANCRPYYYANFSWFIRPAVMVSAIAAYGGYGNFNAGAELEARIFKNYMIHIDSYYLLGYLMPKKFCGQGITIGLSGKF
ncbi:MAG: DUF5723 family protein [Bacteroidota bacterium]